jgi:hypothetical protein
MDRGLFLRVDGVAFAQKFVRPIAEGFYIFFWHNGCTIKAGDASVASFDRRTTRSDKKG